MRESRDDITDFGNVDDDLITYALQNTGTAIWDWSIPEDHVELFPPQNPLFNEINNLDDFIMQVHPDDRVEVQGAIESAIEGRTEYRTEFRLNSDEDRWVEAVGTVTTSDEAEPLRLIGVATDITHRKRSEQNLLRTSDYISDTESIADIGGWEFSIDNRELRWTVGTKQIHDISPDYSPDLEEAFEFYHPEDRPRLRKAFDHCIETGEPYDLEVRIITEEGDEKWLRAIGHKVDRPEEAVIRGLVQDVSAIKIRSQRISVLNRILRHNIRNRLNIIHGNAEILRDQVSPESRDNLDRIFESSDRLMSIADKSQRLNKVINSDSQTNQVKVGDMLKGLCNQYAEKHPEVILEYDLESVAVRGNENAIRILFEELLQNAIKYNDKQEPKLRVTVSHFSDDRVAISVVDNGSGLPDYEQATLIDGEETPLDHSDGIGLWMVNWIATTLNGSISIEANEDEGTAITVTLPIVDTNK